MALEDDFGKINTAYRYFNALSYVVIVIIKSDCSSEKFCQVVCRGATAGTTCCNLVRRVSLDTCQSKWKIYQRGDELLMNHWPSSLQLWKNNYLAVLLYMSLGQVEWKAGFRLGLRPHSCTKSLFHWWTHASRGGATSMSPTMAVGEIKGGQHHTTPLLSCSECGTYGPCRTMLSWTALKDAQQSSLESLNMLM